MSLDLFQVDAFTDRPYAGNPAAVCLLDGPREDAWMQAVAQEMNLSETAFLLPLGRPEEGWRLRWFTPEVEVELCGHATLASAHVLWETGRLRPQEAARFETFSGLLTCRRRGEEIAMDFPAQPVEEAGEPPAGLVEALGLAPRFLGRSRFDFLVAAESEEQVRALEPDFRRLSALQVRGVIVTARASSPRYDFVSRFFAPGAGVPEDPVTGSAHCSLGPYWGPRLGKREMLAWQASTRGGELSVRLTGEDRVELGGRAVLVFEGRLLEGGRD
jgi:PhzF family phenazine biosynthesis protein